ncbi:hypothetical protein MLD38_011444 [Melastoma candidum]|uniref:Uncharacterized protein n=1 Tax=Melastoma candidum TaxID=119954 RepID=A0ACB9R784_9MYRT|nr:hypothetical protein MLD38_011444 [Melastoma candidum]
MPSPILPVSNPATAVRSKHNGIDGDGGVKDFVDDPTDRLLASSRFEDEVSSVRPLLNRSSSYSSVDPAASSGGGYGPQNQRRRRGFGSDGSLPSLVRNGRAGFDREEDGDLENVSAGWFGIKLIKYLGVGYRWIMRFLALGCYSVLLMPGFIQVGHYYFCSRQVRRGIVYGELPRNRLDLYLPKNMDRPKPVVAFVTGGAWIIGYKAWGSLLGQQLSERGIMVACIDYRNFPQGTMSDMVADASRGISFICNKIAEYGGDPNRIYLMGQSAGAHIAACALVEQAIKEFGEGESTSWSISQIKAYFGLSGGYNLENLVDYFHRRGLYRSIFLSIMEGQESLRRFSPELVAQDPNVRLAISRLPPVILFHGTGDYSIPSKASVSFAETLRKVGVEADSILYEGKTHTDLFLQDPMRGGRDDMLEDLVGYIHASDPEALMTDAKSPPRRRMVPEFMLRLARAVSPF